MSVDVVHTGLYRTKNIYRQQVVDFLYTTNLDMNFSTGVLLVAFTEQWSAQNVHWNIQADVADVQNASRSHSQTFV